MTDYKAIFKTSESQNWCKCWTAVYLAREGLMDFVRDEIEVFQTDLLKSEAIGELCTTCTTPNVLPCPTPNICLTTKGVCKYHCVQKTSVFFSHQSILLLRKIPIAEVANWNMPRTCNFHTHFREAILAQHRYNKPSWHNTNAQFWGSRSWDLAKCFMPREGYADKNTAGETDINGFLSVIMNCKRFELNGNSSSTVNICTRIRDLVNNIRHFEAMTIAISDETVTQYIDTLLQLLDQPDILKGDRAKLARDQMLKLKTDNITLTTEDASLILKDALNTIELHVESCKASQKQSFKYMHDELTGMFETSKQLLAVLITDERNAINNLLKTESKKVISLIVKTAQCQIEEFRKCANEIKSKPDIVNKEIKDMVKNTIEVEKSKAEQLIRNAREIEIERIQTTLTSIPSLDRHHYEDLVRDFKEDLMNYYLERHSVISISPSIEEIDTEWKNLHVPSKLRVKFQGNDKGQHSVRRYVDKETHVETYRDILYNGNDAAQNVYIQGECGTGKSTFCVSLIMTWCNIQNATYNDTLAVTKTAYGNGKCLSNDYENYAENCGRWLYKRVKQNTLFTDTDVLKQFDFLFYISLSDIMKTSRTCDVDEMIQHQIVSELSAATNYNKDFLDFVLNNEKCLIILDGLDKWSYPGYSGSTGRTTYDVKCIPQRKSRRNITMLTTSRPWKMTQVNVNHSDIDKFLEIRGVCDTNALLENGINCLNERGPNQMSVIDFKNHIEATDLGHLLTVPLFAQHMLCLWYEDENIGTSWSKCYYKILALLFERSENLTQHVATHKRHQLSQPMKSFDLPSCFGDNVFVQHYKCFIMSISELAYHCLQNKSTDCCEIVIKQCLTEEERVLALQIGILDAGKPMTQLASRKLKYHFIHNTYQDFLAANYLATTSDDSDIGLKTYGKEYWEPESNLLIFLSDMNPNIGIKLSEELMPNLTNKTNVMSQKYLRKVGQIQNMILEGYKDKKLLL